MTTTTSLIAHRNSIPVAYAIVIPPPDGRAGLLHIGAIRLSHGMWPAGFPGRVVAVMIDSGVGTTSQDIRAACTVTTLDRECEAAINGAVASHVWCARRRVEHRADLAHARGERTS